MRNLYIPITIACLQLFFACSPKKPNSAVNDGFVLKIKGSDTEFEMVKKLCSTFKAGDSLDFMIEGGGTELGIKALMEGEADAANASREITEAEKTTLEKKKIEVLPIMFATDAVAIITHPRLGVDSLTLDQLSKIYTGEITNWKALGGPDRKITLYSRNLNSGTYYYFKNKVVGREFIESSKVCQTTKQIVEQVSADSTGIGYVGAGFLMDELGKPSNKVWAMPLSIDVKHIAYSPYQVEEVKHGNYPLTRPLYQYYKMPLNQKTKDFVIYELTQRGQSLVRTFGFFPISDYQKEINKLNGLNL